VTFERPDKVNASGNYIDGDQAGCSLAYVEDDVTLIGFPFEDVCQEMAV